MEHASNHRRKLRGCTRLWQLKIGVLAAVTLLSLGLVAYCFPARQHGTAAAETPALQAGNRYADTNKDKAQQQQPQKEAKQVTIESYIEDNIEAVGSTILKSSAASVLPDAGMQQHSESQASKVAELLPGQCGNGLCRNATIKEDDFVFAVATHRFNEPTLVAGRAGRVGLRTYVCTNYTETAKHRYPAIDSEHWGFYPDDKPLRSFYEGDTRAALVPFLAHRDLGDTFKWLFYGDDDTILFLDAAMKLVKDLDPEMPYFLTDHFWYASWNYGYPFHPHWRAPRCLPCHSDIDVSTLRMGMAKACPCTPQDMCSLEGGYNSVLDKRRCTPPRAPTLTYSMHGGAGALISIGLLKKVSFQQMEDCALGEWNTGGDSFITSCLWKAGYGMTDPGPTWHPEGLTRFDPSPRKLMIDHTPYVIPRASYTIGNLVAKAAGACGTLCQLETEHVISLHLRARLLTNTSFGAGVLLRAVTRFYSLQTGRITGDAESLEALHDVYDAGAARLAVQTDSLFTRGIDAFKSMTPHLKEVAKKQVEWPAEGGASLFVPSKGRPKRGKDKNATIHLSEADLIKGGAAGIAQNVLNDALQHALLNYPPPSKRQG